MCSDGGNGPKLRLGEGKFDICLVRTRMAEGATYPIKNHKMALFYKIWLLTENRMKRLEKRFLPPDNIFKIHWVTIKTAAAAAFYSFDQFLTHIRVQILFHFHFLCSGWPGSNPMGPNTCPNSGLRPTAKKIFSRIECCFMICKLTQTQSPKALK